MFRLLIVEDENFIRNSLERHINWAAVDCQVAGACASGPEALAFLSGQPVDIMLTDIRMDGMDGIELARQVRERQPRVRIVFLTGHSEFSWAQAALRLQADDYLLKPTNPEELARVFRRICAGLAGPDHADGESTGGAIPVPDGSAPAAPAHPVILAMRDYINRNFSRSIGVDEIAAGVARHPKYLCRIVKQETGYTVMDHLLARRMDKAQDLLRDARHSVADVARMVGIADAQYFAKLFRKVFGITPSQRRMVDDRLPFSTKALPASIHGQKKP